MDLFPSPLLCLLLAASALFGYGAYKIYQLPAVALRRRKLSRLVAALFAVADIAASSAEAVALISSDLTRFLRSDSDDIPSSLKQIFNIARSNEFSSFVSRISEVFFASLTNPNHEATMKDMLISVCNGALETLVRTSHQVIADSLSNRRFVLDVTGRITFETVKALLDFVLWKMYDVTRGLVGRGLEVLRDFCAKFIVIFTVCLCLCLCMRIFMRLGRCHASYIQNRN